MFEKKLELLMKNNIPVSIYTDRNNTDSFSFGYIWGLTDSFVMIASITPYGLYDGYLIRKIEDIFSIVEKDNYSKKILTLYSSKNQKHCMPLFHNTDNIIEYLINYAKLNRIVVSIELYDSGIEDAQGFIEECDGDVVVMNQLDEYGRKDGEISVSVRGITALRCDSEKELALKILSMKNN